MEETPVSRKRQHSRSRSRSPSETISEQILKKQRIDYDEINTFGTTNEQISSTSHHSDNDESCKEKAAISDVEEKRRNGSSEVPIDVEMTDSDEKKASNTYDENNLSTEEKNHVEENPENKISSPDSEEENTITENGKDTNLSSNIDEGDKEKGTLNSAQTPSKKLKQDTPSKKLTPKQIQKKLEAEKRHQERLKEKEDQLKKKLEEKERILQEKLKKKEIKDKEIEQKKKEKEEKDEKKKKEREEREQKRKEKEEKEEQKRKERENEKQKKLQEMEEKNKEKLKKEEKNQKVVAAFVNFFVPKKLEITQDERKVQTSIFLDFEVKSDMKLPLPRRECLSTEEKQKLEANIQNQDEQASYLKDLASGKSIGKCFKTWPYEETIDDDVIVVDLGETICEDKSSLQKHKAKFLYFHENRRPAYHGTWRKRSKAITPRKPFAEDKEKLNYEEESDDDWEEEEQGESLNGSDDEAEKENEDEKDDYEVDNEFFVPHGHLSDDEVDDEEMARLSPESLKQKLKLLKEEFDQDMQLKTHKLKPRSIGCIWYNKDGSNVEEAVDRYLQPLAVITRHTQIVIKSRIDIANLVKEKKHKNRKELDPEFVPLFLKVIHGSSKKKSILVEEFLADLQKAESSVNLSKRSLIRKLKEYAGWEKYKDEETKRYKFRWLVHSDLREKYNLEK